MECPLQKFKCPAGSQQVHSLPVRNSDVIVTLSPGSQRSDTIVDKNQQRKGICDTALPKLKFELME